MLVGCGKENKESSSVTEVTEAVEDITFNANGDSVAVILNNEVIQTLNCNYTPDKEKIFTEDYDFDGFDDLFVMMENGAMYASGTYFRYNPDTEMYEKWDTLNKIGRQMIIDNEQQTLKYRKNGSEYWMEYFVYKWDKDNLILSEHSASEDGKTFEDLPLVEETTENTASQDLLSGEFFSKYKNQMSKEDYAALESCFPIFDENVTFNYQHRMNEDSKCKTSFSEVCQRSYFIELRQFTVFDLDNDGIREIIFVFDNAGEILILHKQENDFYAIQMPFRGFKGLQVNGIYSGSGGAACAHFYNMIFENGEFKEYELAHACEYEDDVFSVNGNAVTEEEYKLWKEENMIGDVEWFYI